MLCEEGMNIVEARNALSIPQYQASSTNKKKSNTRKTYKHYTNCGMTNHNVETCRNKKKQTTMATIESFTELRLCFQKCKEYGINLNPDKCAFMVFSRMILGFIISKQGKLLDLKKIQAIVNMPPPKSPQQIQVFNGMA